MIDLGKERKVESTLEGDMPVPDYPTGKDKSETKTVIDYPNLHLESDEMPGIASVAFGQTIKLTFLAKVTGIRKQDYGDGKICYDFDLMQGDASPVKEQQSTKGDTTDVQAMADTKKSVMDLGEAVVPEDAPPED